LFTGINDAGDKFITGTKPTTPARRSLKIRDTSEQLIGGVIDNCNIQRWASKLFFSLQIENPQILGSISYRKLAKYANF
jgi:hypothetical protein